MFFFPLSTLEMSVFSLEHVFSLSLHSHLSKHILFYKECFASFFHLLNFFSHGENTICAQVSTDFLFLQIAIPHSSSSFLRTWVTGT